MDVVAEVKNAERNARKLYGQRLRNMRAPNARDPTLTYAGEATPSQSYRVIDFCKTLSELDDNFSKKFMRDYGAELRQQAEINLRSNR